jgi:hypothetical protein
MKDLKEQIEAICESLYTTGCNDGKNNIDYLPKPPQFRANQLLNLFNQMGSELIGKDETDKNTPDHYDNNPNQEQRKLRNNLKAELRTRLKEMVGSEPNNELDDNDQDVKDNYKYGAE